jgi:hypothetical protein
MERYRHDRVGIRQHVRSGAHHEGGEQRGDRATTVVFQGVDEFSQGALVLPGTARDAEDGR